MFISSVRGGKAFAAEQKIKELKSRIVKLNIQKMKINPIKIIQNSVLNMSNIKSKKTIERQFLAGKRFKTIFNMHEIEKSKRLHDRLERYDRKRYATKRKKLKEG